MFSIVVFYFSSQQNVIFFLSLLNFCQSFKFVEYPEMSGFCVSKVREVCTDHELSEDNRNIVLFCNTDKALRDTYQHDCHPNIFEILTTILYFTVLYY